MIQQIKQERLNQGLTLKQLAEMAGTSYSRLSNIENGKASPTLDLLQRIVNALGKELVMQ